MKLFEKISYLRKNRGMSQEQLAYELDVSRQAVHKWENGITTPEFEKIKRISEIFNITYDELLNDDLDFIDSSVTVKENQFDTCDPKKENVPTKKSRKSNILIPISVIFCVLISVLGVALSSSALIVALAKKPFNSVAPSYEYEITYQNTHDSYNPNALGFNENDDMIELYALYATGYMFDGWYVENKRVTLIDPKIKRNVDLIAKWSIIDYYIFLNDEDNPKNCSVLYYTIESPDVELPTITSENYNFEGWYNGEEKISTVKRGSAGNLTLLAKWTPKTFNIQYKEVEGASNNNQLTYQTNDNTITLNSPTKSGYTFLGWYTDKNYTNKISEIKSGSSGDITLYAKWVEGSYTVISNASDLKNISTKSNYILVDDIDLNGNEWTPIGTSYSAFNGIFNGNGYSISNFKITKAQEYVGFFAKNSGTIKNLTLNNFTIEISSDIDIDVGGLVGYDYKGTISNCCANGKISVNSYKVSAGILVGNAMNSTIKNSYSDGEVSVFSTDYNYVGGFAGWGGNVEISNCYSTASVSATSESNANRASSYTGGFIGGTSGAAEATDSTISNCYSTGNVISTANSKTESSSAYAGGFVGTGGGIFNNCYASGTVQATATSESNSTVFAYAGGFAGTSETLNNCLAATERVSATSTNFAFVGGLTNVGMYEETITNCYRNSNQSTIIQGEFEKTCTLGTSISLSIIKTKDFYETRLNWPISDWNFEDNSLPTLK